MIRMTRLPEEVARVRAALKPYFSYRHYLVLAHVRDLCWATS